MKTILVTGGAGFIGSNFIRLLLNSDDSYLVVNIDKLTYAGNLHNLKEIESNFPTRYKFVKGDICNTELLNYIFSEYMPRFVINFAAESHVDRSILDPNSFIETNIKGTASLLSAAKNAWAGKYKNRLFLQVSTDEVYGSLPLNKKELKFTESTPLSPSSPYSASKTGADLLALSYFHTYDFPTVISRCSNNYGPFQFPEKLIPLMINNAMNDRELPVYGDGLNVRDWIFVDDHCNALIEILKKGTIGEIYNIGSNTEIPNIEIVIMILDILGKPHTLIKYVKDRLGHDRRYAIDSSKIENALKWKPKYKFDEALKYTVQWYIDNQDWTGNILNGEYMNYYKQMYENR
jgi:dTDP-glucose 4,6-dehydratase